MVKQWTLKHCVFLLSSKEDFFPRSTRAPHPTAGIYAASSLYTAVSRQASPVPWPKLPTLIPTLSDRSGKSSRVSQVANAGVSTGQEEETGYQGLPI